MPIIKDPKMNPREKQFGIIEVDGVICFYDKEKRTLKKRFMPVGFFVPSDLIKIKENKNPNDLIFYNGQVINYEAVFNLPKNDPPTNEYNVDEDPFQGPIVKGIFKWAENDPAGVKQLVNTGTLPSDVPT